MALTNICSTYNNPVRRKIFILWKKADMVFVCVNISHSFDAGIPEIHRTRNSGPHSMIKSSKWWPTAFHWNVPPPDIIKPGRTQLSNGLKRRHSQILIWWERQNHLIRLEKQMKQDTRVDFNIYTYGCPGFCHWPQPKTILHLRKIIEKNGSRLPMHSMQRMTQTYQIGYHLHMLPLASWMESRPIRLLDLTRY